MTEPYRSSEEFDEQAHQLYNEGNYEEALSTLREGVDRYPESPDLQVGLGYAQMACEQYAWARQAFELALVLDADHEDALAGIGEVALVLGQSNTAFRVFQKLLDLGFDNDHEMMLQVGRALFREGYFIQARRYFDLAQIAHPESAELTASLGYTTHRLGLESEGFYWLRRALALEPDYPEPRIYLANILYDRSENGAALHHFARLVPEDHFDDLGIWRTIELIKAARNIEDDDEELRPWFARLAELGADATADDLMLAEIEQSGGLGGRVDPNQLELFATLLRDLPEMQRRAGSESTVHTIETLDGLTLSGTWDELVIQLQTVEGAWADGTLNEFMTAFAARGHAETGVKIPVTGAREFLFGAAEAGVIRVLR